ncbi:MAG: 2-C-methyl-D-erythritol 2,4-cyclodiphosphate synthase [Betaproteobacteria bacterium]
MTKCHALIPCAGIGQRMGGTTPKQFSLIDGKPMVLYSLERFIELSEIESIWIGLSPDQSEHTKINWPISDKLKLTLTGGPSRQETVLRTLEEMLLSGISKNDWVLVHDAARPGITQQLILSLIKVVRSKSDNFGGILALPISDSIKKSHNPLLFDAQIESGIPRDKLWLAQTPQMFKVKDLYEALTSAINKHLVFTDEASLFENNEVGPLLILGSLQNFKVTYQDDLYTMEKIIVSGISSKAQLKSSSIRIGQGYDVHKLEIGRDLILGGVLIDHPMGLLGHSDADALTHSIIDACFGAAGLGDIGQHFPDTDLKYKDANSLDLLKTTASILMGGGYSILNVDCTIICQKPKLENYLPQMRVNISQALQIESSRVNIKAKTNENLGYLGNEEAIETQAAVLVDSSFN